VAGQPGWRIFEKLKAPGVKMASEQVNSITKLKSERFTGFCMDSTQGHALAGALLPDPDRLFATGDPVRSPWQSASTDKVSIRFEEQNYFLKRYNCQGVGYRIRNLLRPSRALRSWRNGLHFHQAQLPTVDPILCLEERFFGFLGRSYIVFPHLSDAVSLLDIWSSLGSREQKSLLLTLAETFGRMHRQGIYHGDLNWRNILVRKQSEEPRFFLVDLDGCRYQNGYHKKHARRDLEHFYRDMGRAAVSDDLVREFRTAWQRVVVA
jgi:tRNA A-37 threonylcarbamoyl transferase component Bud32